MDLSQDPIYHLSSLYSKKASPWWYLRTPGIQHTSKTKNIFFSQCTAVLVFGGEILRNFYSVYLLCCYRVLPQSDLAFLIDSFEYSLETGWKILNYHYDSNYQLSAHLIMIFFWVRERESVHVCVYPTLPSIPCMLALKFQYPPSQFSGTFS